MERGLNNIGIDFYTTDVVVFNDYYLFGMLMPGRNEQAGDGYRYGYQGSEKDDEVKGVKGSSYDFGARIYDSRVGRWLTIDALESKYPDLSPYNYVANSPLIFIDIDGNKFVNPYTDAKNEAELTVANMSTQYEELKASGTLSRKDLKILKSEVKSAQKEFQALQNNYQEVEGYLYTLKTTNFNEYNYFETLQDSKGNEINIEIHLMGPASPGGKVAGTENIEVDVYTPTKYRPKAKDNVIMIKLWRASEDTPIELKYNKDYSGRNYDSFVNELGDIQYVFTRVRDKPTYDKWSLSNGGNDPNYRTDPTGAGQQSFRYEENRVEEVQNYVKTELKDGESYNPRTRTINKR